MALPKVFPRLLLLAALALAPSALRLPAAEGGAPTNAPAKNSPEDSAEAQRVLRSYLQLQEQLHATLLAIEQARMENSQSARTNSDALTARLELIEKSLTQAREQQVESMRHSNRTMLTMAGIFVGVGFLTLLFMAFFQLRGMNRLAEIATGMPGSPFPAALGAGNPVDTRLLAPGGGAETSRLHTVISRLEQRIEELEGSAQAAPATNGHGARATLTLDAQPAASHVTVLLGKGQALLNLGQSERALGCFEEALAAAPDNADAHVRKGSALERLKRLDEALACFDRAIALDRSITQAYLCKGSIFNQQERFAEALECYEQALRTEGGS